MRTSVFGKTSWSGVVMRVPVPARSIRRPCAAVERPGTGGCKCAECGGARDDERTATLLGQLLYDADRVVLDVLAHARFAELPSDTALLDTAERHTQVEGFECVRVDERTAGLDLTRD
jgi:hypothetical protein